MANRKKTYRLQLATAKKYIEANPKKITIVAVYLLLALIGLLLSQGVSINYNLSEYLAEDTETSIALEIMTDEFGMTGNVQVMLSDIDKETAKAVKDELSSIEGALNVSFNPDSPDSYKEDGGHALFTVLIDGEDHSDTAKAVIEEIKTRLGSKYGAVELGGSTIEYNALRENTSGEMGLIIVLSISMAAVLLLITASSWIEPIILLACSGVAIAINMGLNIFIGEISYITKSVSSILQLALSVDYSIVVLHTYRDEKKHARNNTEAMRNAVKAMLNPISASALTTVAGLFALLFMSFTIGFDIGIVLIKGIVVSAVTAMTFLPVVVLILDGLIQKTAKKPFIPSGEIFSGLASKRHKIIAPAVAVLILAGSILQSFNSYGFTDSIGSNKTIEKNFGRTDSVVLVYKTGNAEEDYKKEMLLKEMLLEYKNSDGENPLTGYTAYSTTVKEIYDLNRAVSVLGLPESDVKMLFAMYNIYNDNTALTLTPLEFVRYTNKLLNSDDPDVGNMVDAGTKKTIALLSDITELMSGNHTARELSTKISKLGEGGSISDFAIKQMYGLYYFDKLDQASQKINTKQLCTYIIENIKNLGLGNKETSLRSALSNISNAADESEFLTHGEFFKKYQYITIPILGSAQVFESADQVQQLFIMYLVGNGGTANGIPIIENKITGRVFVNFVLETAKTNTMVSAQVNSATKDRLNDLNIVDSCFTETSPLSFPAMTERMNRLQSEIKSVTSSTSLNSEKISGVFIKYAVENSTDATMKPMMACDLLDFISKHMRTNSLLSGKMTEAHHAKVDEAKEMINSAENLFIAENYSRVLLSARLPAEGEEMVSFIDYLIECKEEVFGSDAHITGKVVSTYDLQAAFDVDNLIITVITIISILLVILFIFKSASFPVILVLVIQGSVWISLSLSLIGGGLIFFMSYIVTTCILMGATVDYGILMSNNYLVCRRTEDKLTSLRKAVDSAMPTVFTSGLILVVCGFVISLISSQNSIASVGSLLARGTIVSIIMITVGLPSLLFILDNLILKYTMTDEQTAKAKGVIREKTNQLLGTKAGTAVIKFINRCRDKISPFFAGLCDYIKTVKGRIRSEKIKAKRRRTIEAKKRAIQEAIAKGEPVPVTKKTPGRKPRKAPLTPEEAKAILEKKAKQNSKKKNTKTKENNL